MCLAPPLPALLEVYLANPVSADLRAVALLALCKRGITTGLGLRPLVLMLRVCLSARLGSRTASWIFRRGHCICSTRRFPGRQEIPPSIGKLLCDFATITGSAVLRFMEIVGLPASGVNGLGAPQLQGPGIVWTVYASFSHRRGFLSGGSKSPVSLTNRAFKMLLTQKS